MRGEGNGVDAKGGFECGETGVEGGDFREGVGWVVGWVVG